MPRFSEQFVQQVQQSTDIVDLISQYVSLKRRGKEFVGLCPFHEDHKPSMYVAPAKQIFKCFACGAGGGVFQFLMLYDKLTFPEAIRTLAERANIPLPAAADDSAPAAASGLTKSDLAKLTAFAAEFFRNQLHAPNGAAALQYARARGLTDDSIKQFSLGYAPDSWDALYNAARRKGFSEAQLTATGLAVQRETGGCYDRFRNRLMFPIFDVTGTVIAFGGRAMDEGERAKYLNSPESILFDKSSCLYAINWAREQIVSTGRAVVVEGYLDALMPIQHGLRNVVATLGTSLTDRHVRLLGRYAREAVLLFDADTAGTAAAERALEVFLAQRLHVRVATIPAGKDPCDFCLAEGAEALRKLADEAPDALQYVWRRRKQAYEDAGDNLAERQRLIEEFLRLVVSSAAFGAIDGVRQGQLAQHIGHMLNIPPADLHQQMRRLARQVHRGRSRGGAQPGVSPQADRGTVAERHLLAVLLNRPELFDEAAEKIDPKDFPSKDLQALAEVFWSFGLSGRLTLEDLLASEASARWGALLTDLLAEGEARGKFEETLRGAVEHLVYHRRRREMQHLKESGYTEESLRELHRRLGQADQRTRPKIH